MGRDGWTDEQRDRNGNRKYSIPKVIQSPSPNILTLCPCHFHHLTPALSSGPILVSEPVEIGSILDRDCQPQFHLETGMG